MYLVIMLPAAKSFLSLSLRVVLPDLPGTCSQLEVYVENQNSQTLLRRKRAKKSTA